MSETTRVMLFLWVRSGADFLFQFVAQLMMIASSFAKRLMRRILSDVALRNGLISAGASLLALSLLSVITWLFLVAQLEDRAEDALNERHIVSVQNQTALTDEEREISRKFRRSLPIRDEGVFAWINSEGVTLSSNVSGLDCREGFYDRWIDVSGHRTGKSQATVFLKPVDKVEVDRFRFLARQRGDNCLVFGRSLYEVDAICAGIVNLFLWLVPLCLIPALIISLNQSWKLRNRLRGLARVVRDVSRGDLDARMSVQGSDDIDVLASSANRSFDRLRDSVSTLQQLTSVLAHDLRAPLNRVAIPLEEAMRANEAGETALDSLEIVKDGLDDVRDVFEALLRITQIETGKRRSNFAEVSLYDVAEGLYEIYQPVVEDACQTLEFEIVGEGAVCVLGDAELIRQAAVNLIENATRYAPQGAMIRVGVSRDANLPALYVRDNGPGVPKEERPKILRRLYRYEKSTGGKGGHGLGLSLVKAVVDLHDGEISLEDAEPGLLVRLTFKALTVPEKPANQP